MPYGNDSGNVERIIVGSWELKSVEIWIYYTTRQYVLHTVTISTTVRYSVLDSETHITHESIVDQLERVKAFLGFGQDADFANAMGIRPNQYAKWRRGQQPAFHTIRDAMNRLGMRIDYLANPGNLPEDFRIDEARRERDIDIGSLRVELQDRERRIEELERVLQNFIRTWSEVQDLLPGDAVPRK